MTGLKTNEIILNSLELACGSLLIITGILILLLNLKLKVIVPPFCSFIALGNIALTIGLLIEPTILSKGSDFLHFYMLIMSAVIIGLVSAILAIKFKIYGKIMVSITAGFMIWLLAGQFLNGIIVDVIIGSFLSVVIAIQTKRVGTPVESVAYSIIGAFLSSKGLYFILEGTFRFVNDSFKTIPNTHKLITLIVPAVLQAVLTISFTYYNYKKQCKIQYNSELKMQDLKHSPPYNPIP